VRGGVVGVVGGEGACGMLVNETWFRAQLFKGGVSIHGGGVIGVCCWAINGFSGTANCTFTFGTGAVARLGIFTSHIWLLLRKVEECFNVQTSSPKTVLLLTPPHRNLDYHLIPHTNTPTDTLYLHPILSPPLYLPLPPPGITSSPELWLSSHL